MLQCPPRAICQSTVRTRCTAWQTSPAFNTSRQTCNPLHPQTFKPVERMINRTIRRALSMVQSQFQAVITSGTDFIAQRRERHANLSPEELRKSRLLSLAAATSLFGAVAAFAVAPLAPDAALLPTQMVSEELTLQLADAPLVGADAQQVFHYEERIRTGDSLASLLVRLGVNDANAERFIRADSTARFLYQLRPGRTVRAETDVNGGLVKLVYVHTPVAADSQPLVANRSTALQVVRDGAGFRAEQVAIDNERRLEMRSGEIFNSLYGATDAAGIPDAVANQIAEIFAGDIDFYRDLRRGDQFRVIYEMFYQGGEAARAGRVLAVEFVNNSKTHQAVWYESAGQSGSYYGFDGRSLRRAFLRSPLEFSRISSGFGGRMHPIAQTWRAHTGVDYAAPTGTPVRTTGDGTVDFAGSQSGYGNVVIVRHNGVNTTLYGHLSRFAPGVRTGARVSQGQVVGFVGMTGWATGPHLHYEFRVNNRPLNPLTVTLPQSVPLAQEQLPTFKTRTASFGRQIELLRAFQAAARDRNI